MRSFPKHNIIAVATGNNAIAQTIKPASGYVQLCMAEPCYGAQIVVRVRQVQFVVWSMAGGLNAHNAT